MPVEIRELVIKTTIVSRQNPDSTVLDAEKMAMLKKQVIQECLKALKDKAAKNSFDR